jgi:hypothetical protein
MLKPNMSSFKSVFPFAAIAAAAPSLRAPACDCYLIDGSHPTYYSSYGFWDFRSLSQYAGVPEILESIDANQNAPVTSGAFSAGSEFAAFWKPVNRLHGNTFSNQYSPNNLYIEMNSEGGSDTYLTMRTARLSGFQASAEIDSLELIDHASMRMYARSFGDPGACTAMFTYLDNTNAELVQESDLEILTRDPSTAIHYTNQPAQNNNGQDVPGSSDNITIPVPWTEWATHRLDWTEGSTTWSFNGEEMLSKDFQAPKDPSLLMFNSWSNAGGWTGEMAVGGSAYQQIQWIEVLYGITDEGSCNTACSVDVEGAGPGSLVQL